MSIYTGNLPENFLYVPQDNYIFCNPETDNLDYLYSDSATSCIILVLTGKDRSGNPLVALTHLSRQARFEAFIKMVDEKFSGAVSLYAQGANPSKPVPKGESFSYDALANIKILIEWVSQKSFIPTEGVAPPDVYLEQVTLALGIGDPNDGHGGYGIDVNPSSKDYLTVSNKYFYLLPSDRDPDGGIQSLFCIFGMRTEMPSLVLHNVRDPFTDEEKSRLVALAKERKWTDLLKYNATEILHNYSTTPDYEPRWFVDNLIESAQYVQNFANGQ